MIRKLDKLGRIVIPVEIRNQYNLKEGDKIEIEEKKNQIILKKYKDTYCPQCLTRCEHTDNFCRKCGMKFITLHNKYVKDGKHTGVVVRDELCALENKN